MHPTPSHPERARVGLVLAGGAARGAYEVGVLEYIVEEVSKELGYDVPLDILSGTSVGAINTCMLAAFADEPRGRLARLASVWTNLRIDEVLTARSRGVYHVLRGFVGRRKPALEHGGLFDPEPLARILRRAIPFERIDGHLRAGRISAVTVTATQIATGRTMVFVQRRHARPEPWDGTPNIVPRSVRLRTVHALASGAVPVLFPAVKIDGRYYCDGGIRLNIPLSPARRLGAHSMIVVNPRFRRAAGAIRPEEAEREEAFPTLPFLLGKTLNALMLDRIDNDLDRLEKINEMLLAGQRRYGDDFTQQLNEEMGYAPGKGLRVVRTVHIRSSENIGQRCAEYVRSPDFEIPGMLGRVMKQLAEGEGREADLLTYMLFDGDFAAQLIELGRKDARAQHDELCELFDDIRKKREVPD